MSTSFFAEQKNRCIYRVITENYFSCHNLKALSCNLFIKLFNYVEQNTQTWGQ